MDFLKIIVLIWGDLKSSDMLIKLNFFIKKNFILFFSLWFKFINKLILLIKLFLKKFFIKIKIKFS